MLIRNAKDTAGKSIEVWLRGDKIAAIGQGLVDRRINRELVLGDPGDDLPEEIGIGRQILLAFDFAAEMERAELGQRVLKRRPADIHLIQRLNGS